jgi:hypothetical protein
MARGFGNNGDTLPSAAMSSWLSPIKAASSPASTIEISYETIFFVYR